MRKDKCTHAVFCPSVQSCLQTVRKDECTCAAFCPPAFVRQLRPEESQPGDCLLHHRAADNADECVTVLTAMAQHVAAEMCVFGEITDRLPETLKAFVRDEQARWLESFKAMAATEALDQQGAKRSKVAVGSAAYGDAFIAKVSAEFDKYEVQQNLKLPCHTCGKVCPVYAKLKEWKKNRPRLCDLYVAGISCTDWSSRGLQAGALGKSAEAFLTVMFELRRGCHAIAIFENTPRFNVNHIATCLGDAFTVHSLTFSPTDLGWPCSRHRQYIVCLRAQSFAWIPGQELNRRNFLCLFGRELKLRGSAFMEVSSKQEVRSHVEQLAARRHLPLRDGSGRRWSMWHMLSANEQRRLEGMRSAVQEKAAEVGHDDVFVYTCQNSAFNSVSVSVPALLRKSKVWSWGKKRLLLPQEHLRVMGVQLPPGLEITEGDTKSLAGAALTAVMLFTLGCTKRIEESE